MQFINNHHVYQIMIVYMKPFLIIVNKIGVQHHHTFQILEP
uniref:Uncharacterized protein n=1 Tax=Rhizophora mucronata TaxID=61149 RepID=A0A2P2PYZ1_RHIMU